MSSSLRSRLRSKPAAPSGSGSGDYRPALDGVRAAAVIAVIVYHVGGRTKGGFLGVDVFFVLSGYLITTLLLRERLATGTVRMAEFWARRARRLLPAVLLLLAVTAAVTALSTPAVELSARRGDMVATLLYFANWHFIATDANYFADFLGASPLRHMWSLAIEEQFYIVWPLVLLGALSLTKGRRGVLLGAVIVAVLLSAALMATTYDPANPSRVYYGTGSHAFPLLIGAGLAILLSLRPGLLSEAAPRRLAAWAWPPVLAVLFVAVLALDDRSGLYYQGGLLLFALGVGVMLWVVEALPSSLPARALSLRPVCWIGVISYGLYLWHWPLLVWIGSPDAGDGPLTAVAVIALTFMIATLSFYLLERPVRAGRAPWVGRSRRRLALALASAFVLVGAATGWATQIDKAAHPLAAQVTDTADIPCPEGSPAIGSRSWCMLVEPATDDAPVLATAGDSTSRPLTVGLSDLAEERGWGYVQVGQDGCSALPLAFASDGGDPVAVEQGQNCAREAPMILAGAERDFDPDVWFISDRWPMTTAITADGTVLPPGNARRDRVIVAEMTGLLDRLTAQGDQVVLIETLPAGPPVECADAPLPECDYFQGSEEAAQLNALLAEAVEAADGDVSLISLEDIVCPNGECPVAIDGTLIRYDGIHFTATFSRRLAPALIERAQHAGIELETAGEG